MADGSDSPKEACGVFGVRDQHQPVAHLTYLGLYALQHRGQESAGIAVSDGTKVTVDKDMGLVSTIFSSHRLQALPGTMAIGHVRYATTGASAWNNAQPISRYAGGVYFALGHNGNLVNTRELTAHTGEGEAGSDSDVVAALLAQHMTHHNSDLADATLHVLPRLHGAYSFVIMDEARLIGARDPHGFRPLFLGSLDTGGWVLASETPALDVVGARTVREIDPGEMVIIDDDGVRSVQFATGQPRALCSFEFVYIARPDGHLAGIGVHAARRRMGIALAQQAPADADMVMPIPDSSIPGAQGYAQAAGIAYGDGLIKNRYIGRTFIAPSQQLRDSAVRLKFNAIGDNVTGKRLVVVEDSIVRATTLRATMRLLRDAGAAEIHLRVLSPPYRWPCYYGLDTHDRHTLVAATMTVDEIRDHLGADSLAYLDIDTMLTAITTDQSGFCTACLTGDYPTPIPGASEARIGTGTR
ncbi:amidophosphoribosyltransferase [Paractinoplanes rishiriensis]|uniref:Amidophosphoribosyltransferase n=1 Tax=Paractinoplanes rishiriensis TaxID=1050105 RepID=A0A919K8V5_9ACTN|nr:amidophosphoribosyltransferase [Actinoplanes rishiriensis]GIF01553.1 amidophosphoribosyltransferase [Actinoplanes rishiriensis]